MFRSAATSLAILHLAASAIGCNPPPVGLYQTQFHDGVEFVRRGERRLLMDICVPRDAPSPHPGILLIHGGGWHRGDRGGMRPMAQFLASLGYTAATADYRLFPEGGVFPAPVQDALAAVKFLRSHAGDYRIDPQRIAIGGDSAGGQIALVAGLANSPAEFADDSYRGVSPSVAAIVDFYGPTDLAPLFEHGGWYVRYVSRGYLGCTPAEYPEKWRQASPISHVRPDAPPVLILHGDADEFVPISQAGGLDQAIRRVGGRCQLARMPGGRHGWASSLNSGDCQRTLPVLTQFLAQSFAKP